MITLSSNLICVASELISFTSVLNETAKLINCQCVFRICCASQKWFAVRLSDSFLIHLWDVVFLCRNQKASKSVITPSATFSSWLTDYLINQCSIMQDGYKKWKISCIFKRYWAEHWILLLMKLPTPIICKRYISFSNEGRHKCHCVKKCPYLWKLPCSGWIFHKITGLTLYLSRNLQKDWQFDQNRWIEHPIFSFFLLKMPQFTRFSSE